MEQEARMAVVTGGGSGLGRAIAMRLAREGASVAAVDIDATAAQETAQQIQASGGRALGLRADVTMSEELCAT